MNGWKRLFIVLASIWMLVAIPAGIDTAFIVEQDYFELDLDAQYFSVTRSIITKSVVEKKQKRKRLFI